MRDSVSQRSSFSGISLPLKPSQLSRHGGGSSAADGAAGGFRQHPEMGMGMLPIIPESPKRHSPPRTREGWVCLIAELVRLHGGRTTPSELGGLFLAWTGQNLKKALVGWRPGARPRTIFDAAVMAGYLQWDGLDTLVLGPTVDPRETLLEARKVMTTGDACSESLGQLPQPFSGASISTPSVRTVSTVTASTISGSITSGSGTWRAGSAGERPVERDGGL